LLGKAKSKDIKVIKIPGEKIIEAAFQAKVYTFSAFGKLHKLGVIMDKKLEQTKQAIFAAGSTNHSIKMAVKDFIKLEAPIIGSFSVKKKIIKPKINKSMAKKKAVKKSKKKACGCGCK
jgi:hypothetical protein